MTEPPRQGPPPIIETGRYSRWAAVVALVLLVLIAVNTVISTPGGAVGIKPGHLMPPFAAPLATGSLQGAADVATGPNQGSSGRVPACLERGPQILNICQLYERGPVVLAIVVISGGCTRVLDELQTLLPRFPGLQGAGVVFTHDRRSAALLARRLSLPIGQDRDGAVTTRYAAVSCPELVFAYPGGVVASKPLFATPSAAQLELRIRTLYEQSLARGWKAPRA
jgi:hypothetical protein